MLASAQAVITDTVSLGAGYANQVWYSLANDNQGSAPKNNWDIAFDCSTYGSSILINSVTGTKLWVYPGDSANWTTLDTTGMAAGWTSNYNSDTSWALGAFSQGASSQFDLGWGIYNPVTHYVDGDSLYVLKLANNSFRKIRIIQLANGSFTFRYAMLDNSGDQTVQLMKSNYAGKNFAYYSLQNSAALDREPVAANWDLLFTQYTAFIPQPYTVAGVLSNIGVTVADARPVDVNTVSHTSYIFITPMNEIGYDWKAFVSSAWVIEDSLVYFVQTVAGDIWKMIFTGFGGSSSGNYIFTKQLVSAAGLEENSNPVSMTVYPNPASNGQVNILLSAIENTTSVMTITDITGQLVHREQVQGQGLQQIVIGTGTWASGVYFVTVSSGGFSRTQKLIIR
ncbi:MAG: hypothetical protein FD123_930 [Bacteroidetes bacterium]|nr:MAG: hypothetical protein FD123_930 [Bacteroidota bacterium]